MGNETVLVGSAGSSVVGSNGSVVAFPSGAPGAGNVWRDKNVTGLNDVRIMADLSASTDYAIRLMASFTDAETGSSFKGVVESFGPSDTLGTGTGSEVFRSDGPHEHFEWIEVENSASASNLTVNALGVVWESANG